jgi:hypothetical protein
MAAQSWAGEKEDARLLAPVYEVLNVDDLESMVYEDALALDLDLAGAKVIENWAGWWMIESEGFELKRHYGSAWMAYLNRAVAPKTYVEGTEPVDESWIEDAALEIFEQLGLPLEEVGRVETRKIVDQGEDAFGQDVGPRETAAWLVLVTRELSKAPVVGSEARFVFLADGALQEVWTSWRAVSPTPVRMEHAQSGRSLRAGLVDLVGERYPGFEVTVVSGGYAYVEDAADTAQKEMALRYGVRYLLNGQGPWAMETVAAGY